MDLAGPKLRHSGGASAAGGHGRTASIHRTLPPRTREAIGRIAVRSHTVRAMKLLLPAAAFALIAAVVLWPYVVSERSGFPIEFADLEQGSDDVSMIDARFVGTDDNNLPFTVSATRVDNLMPGATEMELHEPAADITLDDGSWVLVRSRQGEYAVEAEHMDLTGDVQLFHDAGYQFETSQATVDLEHQVIAGSEPVSGHGPLGELTAAGFRILDRGSTIVFSGPARLMIFPSAMNRDSER